MSLRATYTWSKLHFTEGLWINQFHLTSQKRSVLQNNFKSFNPIIFPLPAKVKKSSWILSRAWKALFGKCFNEGAVIKYGANGYMSPISIVTVFHQLESLTPQKFVNDASFQISHFEVIVFLQHKAESRQSVRVRSGPVAHYQTHWFLEFYSALGCNRLILSAFPYKPEKYNPCNFIDIFSNTGSENK